MAKNSDDLFLYAETNMLKIALGTCFQMHARESQEEIFSPGFVM